MIFTAKILISTTLSGFNKFYKRSATKIPDFQHTKSGHVRVTSSREIVSSQARQERGVSYRVTIVSRTTGSMMFEVSF